MLKLKYPIYKMVRDSKDVIMSGCFILDGTTLKNCARANFADEGFELPESEEGLETFIVDSFQDVIANNVEYDAGSKYVSIRVLEKLHGKKWTGDSTYVMDYAEMLMTNIFKRHPFGMWDVFFRNGGLFVIYQGNYAEVLYRYMKHTNSTEIPSIEKLVSFSITGTVQEDGISDFR
tara:strand:+ start:75650 stop:76177 length:528 start_codon:yes stop_codon:yes gene_type:complete